MTQDRFFSHLGVFAMLAVLIVAGCRSDRKSGGGDEGVAAIVEDIPDGLTKEQADKVVARVGERIITVGDITRQINRLSPYIRRRWAAPEKRKEFLEKLVRVELLSQEAERLGLDQDPEVQRSVKQMMIRMMISNDLEKTLLPTTVEEAALRAEYEKDSEKYHRPEQSRASQIVLRDKAAAVKLISELKAAGKDLSQLFREKAREVSIDEATKMRGGDLGYFARPEYRSPEAAPVPEELMAAAWKIANVGELYGQPVETPSGFHVVMLTNKKPAMTRSFESVKRSIEDRLLRDQRRVALDKFIDELRAKADIKIFDENVAKLGKLVPKTAPVSGDEQRRPAVPFPAGGASGGRGHGHGHGHGHGQGPAPTRGRQPNIPIAK